MWNQYDKRFTWVIKKFSSFGRDSEIYSDIFVAGGCKWRLIAYPKGTNKYGYGLYGYLSLYICVPDSKSLPSGWRRIAKIFFTIANQTHGQLSQMEEAEYCFDQNNTTWGFKDMIQCFEFEIIEKGFMVNRQVKIVAEVDVLEVIGTLDVSDEPESIDNNGYQVPASQIESVSSLFEKYPGFASKTCPQTPLLRETYVNVVLSLTEILCKSPKELSNGDLAEAYSALRCVTKAGYKLDWLEKKLKETGETRLQEIEQESKDLSALLEFLR